MIPASAAEEVDLDCDLIMAGIKGMPEGPIKEAWVEAYRSRCGEPVELMQQAELPLGEPEY